MNESALSEIVEAIDRLPFRELCVLTGIVMSVLQGETDEEAALFAIRAILEKGKK